MRPERLIECSGIRTETHIAGRIDALPVAADVLGRTGSTLAVGANRTDLARRPAVAAMVLIRGSIDALAFARSEPLITHRTGAALTGVAARGHAAASRSSSQTGLTCVRPVAPPGFTAGPVGR